jgi:hypothetical protein
LLVPQDTRFFTLTFNIMKIMKSVFLILLFVSAGASLPAQKKSDPVGTWSFYAEDAPYEYNSGDMVIDKEGKGYTAKIVYGESYEIKGIDVVLEKDQLYFKVYIEGEPVSIKGTVTRETIKGTATYSEGTVTFEAERKKEEKK